MWNEEDLGLLLEVLLWKNWYFRDETKIQQGWRTNISDWNIYDYTNSDASLGYHID